MSWSLHPRSSFTSNTGTQRSNHSVSAKKLNELPPRVSPCRGGGRFVSYGKKSPTQKKEATPKEPASVGHRILMTAVKDTFEEYSGQLTSRSSPNPDIPDWVYGTFQPQLETEYVNDIHLPRAAVFGAVGLFHPPLDTTERSFSDADATLPGGGIRSFHSDSDINGIGTVTTSNPDMDTDAVFDLNHSVIQSEEDRTGVGIDESYQRSDTDYLASCGSGGGGDEQSAHSIVTTEEHIAITDDNELIKNRNKSLSPRLVEPTKPIRTPASSLCPPPS